jgi:phosphate transport system substrate-binding protein
MTFALTRRLAVAAVVNRDGRAVRPSVQSVGAAARDLDPPADLRFTLLDRPGADSYPLSGATWAVLYADQPDGRAADVAAFLRWCLTAGQAHCGDLHYAPLPAPLAARAAAAADGVK